MIAATENAYSKTPRAQFHPKWIRFLFRDPNSAVSISVTGSGITYCSYNISNPCVLICSPHSAKKTWVNTIKDWIQEQAGTPHTSTEMVHSAVHWRLIINDINNKHDAVVIYNKNSTSNPSARGSNWDINTSDMKSCRRVGSWIFVCICICISHKRRTG